MFYVRRSPSARGAAAAAGPAAAAAAVVAAAPPWLLLLNVEGTINPAQQAVINYNLIICIISIMNFHLLFTDFLYLQQQQQQQRKQLTITILCTDGVSSLCVFVCVFVYIYFLVFTLFRLTKREEETVFFGVSRTV